MIELEVWPVLVFQITLVLIITVCFAGEVKRAPFVPLPTRLDTADMVSYTHFSSTYLASSERIILKLQTTELKLSVYLSKVFIK